MPQRDRLSLLPENSGSCYSVAVRRRPKALREEVKGSILKLKQGPVSLREVKQGRKGKTVTAVYGLDAMGSELAETARLLKRRCGTGGSVKAGVLFIQGDHRTAVQDELQKQGYKVKMAGG